MKPFWKRPLASRMGEGLLAVVLGGGWLSNQGQVQAAAPALMTTNAPELIRLITLDPGHFHAALFYKQPLAGISDTVHVYAPLDRDLLLYLERMVQFNSRADHPTQWKLEIHTGPDFLERLLSERPGHVVVVSGRNQGKIERVKSLLDRGLHVLADKPWIIEVEDLPKLDAALDTAAARGVVGYDAMTQRFEVTCLLQKELVNDPAVFGDCLAGSAADPAVRMESVHYLLKEVAGVPSRRPPWFFDVRQQGEGLADVGTHLADLVQWILFPGQSIHYQSEIHVLHAARWPTPLTCEQFQRVTGEPAFPDYLAPFLRRSGQGGASPASGGGAVLDYDANNGVLYAIRGVYVSLTVRWEFAPAPGVNDSETAIFRGTKARVEVRQGAEEHYRAEVYVVPNEPGEMAELARSLQRRIDLLQGVYSGLAFEQQRGRLRLLIPDRYRVGHEEHFGLLTRQFLGYVRAPASEPEWEKPNMLAKYYVTTQGVALARSRPTPGPITNETK